MTDSVLVFNIIVSLYSQKINSILLSSEVNRFEMASFFALKADRFVTEWTMKVNSLKPESVELDNLCRKAYSDFRSCFIDEAIWNEFKESFLEAETTTFYKGLFYAFDVEQIRDLNQPMLEALIAIHTGGSLSLLNKAIEEIKPPHLIKFCRIGGKLEYSPID